MKIKCYLCGSEASEKASSDYGRGFDVDCSSDDCSLYTVRGAAKEALASENYPPAKRMKWKAAAKKHYSETTERLIIANM